MVSGQEFVGSVMILNANSSGSMPRGIVRLVGPSAIDEMNDTVGQSVSSLMFTERSRTGILIRLPTKPDFGYPPEGLTKINDDTVVLCDL